MDVVRGDLRRPDDPLVPPVLLDRGGEHPARPDPVGAHHDRLLDAVLVQVPGAERLRVAGAELEDVADLDRRLEAEPAAANRARVALLRLPDVGELGLVVTARLDAAEVPAGAVRAGDELALAERLVGERPGL